MACEEPDGSTLHAEVEQLLLAPGAWLADSLGLFGLSLGGIQVRAHFAWLAWLVMEWHSRNYHSGKLSDRATA